MKVIQYVDPTGQTMVARVPRQGTAAIKLGSQLLVEESQQAVFFRDGKALDTFGPGRHTLATQNLPLSDARFSEFRSRASRRSRRPSSSSPPRPSSTSSGVPRSRWSIATRSWPWCGCAPSASSRCASTTRRCSSTRWLAPRGLHHRRCRVLLQGRAIVARLTDLLGENLTSIFDLPKVYDELAMGLKARVADDFSKYGIELVDLYLGAITPPEEVQKLIDERTGMAAVGDMNAYLKFKAAKAMGDAAQQSGGETGSGVGAGLGVGMGAGMGMMLPQMMKEAMQDQGGQQSPPSPGERRIHNPNCGRVAAEFYVQLKMPRAATAAAAAFCHQCWWHRNCRKRRNSVLPAVPRWAARQTGFEVGSSRPDGER